MIYLIYGTDTDKSRKKLRELVTTLRAKKPDASYVKVTDENADSVSLEELIGAQGLFEHKMIIEMDMVMGNKERRGIFIDRLKDLAASDNIFIFLEGALLKADVAKFTKVSDKVQEFVGKGKVEKKGASFFSLADALGRKDKKELWVLYTKALAEGAAPEELHGILFWEIKSLIQAKEAKTPAESGLHPFVYKKSLAFAQKFTSDELRTLSSKLVALYHEARRGKIEFAPALERVILEL